MITVEISQSYDKIELDSDRLRELVCLVCEQFDLKDAAVSIAIIDDCDTIKLNKKFLNREETTDCISFDLSENGSQKVFDIVINGQMAIRQSEIRGHTPQAETALYIVHGLLHNLGFNDEDIHRAEKMHETEDSILTQAGYGKVYKNK